MEHFCRLVPLRFPSGASFHRRFIVSPSLQLYSAQLSWQVPNLCLSVTQLSISAINRDSMQTALRNAILDILFTHVFHVKHCDQAVVWQYTSVWWQPDTDPWPALVSSVNCCQWTQPVSTLWASLLLSTLAAFKAVFGLQQPTHTHTHTHTHARQIHWFSTLSKTTSILAWTLTSMLSEPTEPQMLYLLPFTRSPHTLRMRTATSGCCLFQNSAQHSTQSDPWSWLEN